MTMGSLEIELFALQDLAYRDFNSRLVPNVPKECMIGVRVPLLRGMAREMRKNGTDVSFLQTLPHTYFEENLLHAYLLDDRVGFSEAQRAVEAFLPFVDNWAVCDGLHPKGLGQDLPALYLSVRSWLSSEHEYSQRFAIACLMKRFLGEGFFPEVLDLVAAHCSEAYYVKMMQAWFFATALAMQYEATVPVLEDCRLGIWVHNKTILKACESFRVAEEHKVYLRFLRRRAIDSYAYNDPVL